MGFYTALFLLMAFLYRADRASRKRLGGAAFLAVCSVAGILAANFLEAGGASAGLVKLLSAVSRFFAVRAAVNVAGVLAFSFVLPRLRAGISKFVEDLILAGAYVAAGLAVISASGANLSGILATSAVVTGVVAFSLQDTLGNIIGGMVLHLENSFAPGDWIGVDKYEGVVREIRWRQTTLETLDGDVVIIPNIIIMKTPVTVLGRVSGNIRFRAVSFNVGYECAPGKVINAVEEVLRADPPACVAPAPAPYCAIKDLQPASVAYEARYYLSDLSQPGRTDSGVRAKVYYSLSRAGIKLSIPVRSIVTNEGALAAEEKKAKEELEKRLAALKSVEVFRALTEKERELIAGLLNPAPFSGGEMITRQGAGADCLYIISEGQAEVRLYSGDSGSYRTVNMLGPGDVLGEMGLFTGEPRSATVVAAGEAYCYRLDRESFRGILSGRPEIAGSIASMLAKRRVELAEAREHLAGADEGRGFSGEQQDLLSRIRNFFKL